MSVGNTNVRIVDRTGLMSRRRRNPESGSTAAPQWRIDVLKKVVAAEAARREAEIKRAEKGRVGKIDVKSSTCVEDILNCLRDNGWSVKKIAQLTEIPLKAVENYLLAMSRAKLVFPAERGKRYRRYIVWFSVAAVRAGACGL